MPAIPSLIFTATHTDGTQPSETAAGSQVWNLNGPLSAESCLADDTTSVDFHYTVTFPKGYKLSIAPIEGDIAGAAECTVKAKEIIGTGAAIALKLDVINPSATAQTPTDAAIYATAALEKIDYYITSEAGSWDP